MLFIFTQMTHIKHLNNIARAIDFVTNQPVLPRVPLELVQPGLIHQNLCDITKKFIKQYCAKNKFNYKTLKEIKAREYIKKRNNCYVGDLCKISLYRYLVRNLRDPTFLMNLLDRVIKCTKYPLDY